MSGSSTPLERDQQMLSIGKQCSDSTCGLVDFLPFKCQHCAQSYCAEHFRPTAHHCEQYDESKYNRVAPECPLCNEPVAIPPGEDPNVRMDRHFDTDCSVMTGKTRKAKSGPTCARGKCGKVLFAPIRCQKCNQQFCPEHRFPADHSCSSTASSSKPSTSKPSFANAKSQASAAGAQAMAAFKRSATAASAAKPSLPPSSTSNSKNPPNLPHLFSKTDRRAKQERESQRRAMQARASKGLLSAEEKTILAALEAERAQGVDGDKGCVMM
ncbi:hypothetical protein BV25DRAFT_1838930 [Artomyces pyxidatus]|uniref:Uncharacterized protein n=1 Tax=Artomyces pyxidatus TaxID=48021 RepID=A0ACB8SYZ9_9AGAM|nr:hypothetical protein BV25DRAFT_1838930 [Artomyces pyxidatus]